MDKAQKINLAGKDYEIIFSYGSFRWLGRKWGLNKPMMVMNHIGKVLKKVDKDGLTFEEEDIIIDLIRSGMGRDDIDSDTLIESNILLDIEKLELVFNLFQESFTDIMNVGKKPATPPIKHKTKTN